MEVIQSIGLNSTLFYQLVIFLVTYILLNTILFKPYFKAQQKRESLTVGSDEEAIKILAEVDRLESEFGSEAKDHNIKIKEYFSEAESSGKSEAAKIISVANTNAKGFLASQREEIKNQLSQAKQHLAKEVPEISSAIAGQLLGKDVR